MLTKNPAENISQILSKASIDMGKDLAELDLNSLRALIKQNSKLLDEYIIELRDYNSIYYGR